MVKGWGFSQVSQLELLADRNLPERERERDKIILAEIERLQLWAWQKLTANQTTNDHETKHNCEKSKEKCDTKN